jgi:hypothetical protein
MPQVLRDGVWHLVQPLPGAFTINVGVSLHYNRMQNMLGLNPTPDDKPASR